MYDPTDLMPILAYHEALAALLKAKEESTIRAIGCGYWLHDSHCTCIGNRAPNVSLTYCDYNGIDTIAEKGLLETAVAQTREYSIL